MYISKHTDLMNDPIVGENYLRFLPNRFSVKGEALDPRGMSTSDLACPRCHLPVPETLLEMPSFFISMIGSPASGKSYFLTTMIWALRSLMPRLCLEFTDADPEANSVIHSYENALFDNPHPDRLTEILKTQADDPNLHRNAIIDGVSMRFPCPLQFRLWPTPEHSKHAQANKIGRVVVLYDNAGEDFLPGAGTDGANSAVVQHLAQSKIILVLFDPTQDPRFRSQCTSDDPQLTRGLRPGSNKPTVIHRQETLLKEATVRVRRYLGMSQDERLRKPLIVVVPKFDIWSKMTDLSLDQEPYIGLDGDGPVRMDIARVEQTSDTIRNLFRRLCPEFIATAESLSEIVRYIPVSSLGTSPELVRRGEHTFYGIRPRDINSKWVSVPLPYCLYKWAPSLITS